MSTKDRFVAFLRDEEGLTTVEYAVAGGLIALVVLAAFTDLGKEIARVIQDIVSALKTVKPGT